LIAVVTVKSNFCVCISDDDGFERDVYNDRKMLIGFFSKFWELQVDIVLSQ